ncbi:putative peptidoglycan binding domain protein [Enhygromyxa salina]|uniref:Putative peptidoglycan binding domain protein n=1 Tax=Enhygromyxa salina TaxID=215803 RepID=A0A2S9YAY2_9BACT|nr:peptidoglycan-binding domain-containing protein [Enhygromyxa salina]PRQ02278.1 putative peptidoglycan binding domain protein [Enhygromyxa salina]
MGKGSRHTASQGDSVESIAYAAGHTWETVWDAPENSELRELRSSAHVIQPGDEVYIPPLELRTESIATGQQHKIRRKSVPSKLTVRFLVDGEPRADAAYTFSCDGVERSGTTDGDGWLEESTHPLATLAEVRFTLEAPEDPDHLEEPADDDAEPADDEPEDEEEDDDAPLEEVFRFDLREMDPSSELSGAQARLHLLGYGVNGIDGVLDEPTRVALRAFQEDNELDITGELDDATVAKLAEFTDG